MESFSTATEKASEDLDINTQEGLQVFLQYVEDTYREILDGAKIHADESTHERLQQASLAYETLKQKFSEAFSLKDQDAHIDEELADDLQDGYNSLLDILDSLGTESLPQEILAEDPVVVTEEEPRLEESKISWSSEVDAVIPVVSIAPEVRGFSSAVEEVPEPRPLSGFDNVEEVVSLEERTVVQSEGELVIDEGESVESGALKGLKESTDALIERAETLLSKYAEITEITTSDAVLNIGQHYYKQLAVTAERAKGIHRTVEMHVSKNDKVTELFVEHTTDALDEIADNLDQLDRGLSGFFEKESESTPLGNVSERAQTGLLEVAKEDETEAKNVPIVLVKKPEPVPEVQPREEKSAIHNQTVRPISDRLEKVLRGEWGTLIGKIITIPRYEDFVAHNFTSPTQFEAMLRREVGRIEAPSRLDAMLGHKRKSAFNDLLRDMTIKEVVEFNSRSPRDLVREDVEGRDIEYKIYLDWIDSLNSMLSITHAHPTITFGELFIRAELETLMQHEELLAA